MQRWTTLIVLFVLTAFLGALFFTIVSPFLLPLFLSVVLAVVCLPVQRYFLWRTGNRPYVAAGLTTAALMAMVLLPLFVTTVLTASEFIVLAQNRLTGDLGGQGGFGDQVEAFLLRWQPWLGPNWTPDTWRDTVSDHLRAALDAVGQRTLNIASSALGMLGSLAGLCVSATMFLIAFYYLLADGPGLGASAKELIPLPLDHQRELYDRFANVTRAVLLSTFLSAIAQGIATALACWMCGAGHFFVFSVIGTFTAMIPVAGTWMVWAPVAVWLAAGGFWTAAVLLTLFGIVVIGLLDNVVRTYILQSDARLHPLLAFISVFGGLQSMGLWGVVIGPIVAACFHGLVELFNAELRLLTLPESASVDAKAPPTSSTTESPVANEASKSTAGAASVAPSNTETSTAT